MFALRQYCKVVFVKHMFKEIYLYIYIRLLKLDNLVQVLLLNETQANKKIILQI